jgi:type II secretory pathway component PulC
MRRSRSRSGLVVLLGLACLLLAWVIYQEVATSSPINVMEPVDHAEADMAAVEQGQAAAYSMPDRRSLAVILERPVFTQTRRPIGVAGGGAQEAVDFSLSGVVISGNVRSALVRSGDSGTVQQFKVGDTIGGWTLVEVAADRVVVRRDALEAEVFLDYAAPAPPVPRPEITETPPKEAPAKSNENERQMNGAAETKPDETSND